MPQSTKRQSQLLVISHDKDDFNSLSSVLQHYFPHPNNNTTQNKHQHSTILISNKYYKADVVLVNKLWKDLSGFEKLQEQGNEEDNEIQNHAQTQTQQGQQMQQVKQKMSSHYDLLIMLITQSQHDLINYQTLDQIIQHFNPQQFLILINTTNPQQQWKYQQTILQKCNNFIQVVKEDLAKIFSHKPIWARGALLHQEEEASDQGIFSLLDRMETTRWRYLVNKGKKEEGKNEVKEVIKNELNEKKKQLIQKVEKQTTQQQLQQQPQTQSLTPIQSSLNKENPSSDEQADQSKLQSQALQFEQMMCQMMSFKVQSTGMKDDERKVKAEQLFSKMFKGMMGE